MDLIICSNGDAVVDHRFYETFKYQIVVNSDRWSWTNIWYSMLFKVNNKINYKLKN